MPPDAPDHQRLDPAGGDAAGYIAAVERFWLLLRRRGLMVSAEDVRQIEVWRDIGLPARIVCRALLEGAERFRAGRPLEPLPSTLRYFRETVAEAAERWREQASVRGTAPDPAPEGGTAAAAALGALIAPLVAAGRAEPDERARAAYREAWRHLERLRRAVAGGGTGDLVDPIEALVAVDRGLVDDLLVRLSDAERAAVNGAVAAALAPEEDRLGARALTERRRALLEDAVTRRYRLLRLVPSPPGGPTAAGMGWWRPGEGDGEWDGGRGPLDEEGDP